MNYKLRRFGYGISESNSLQPAGLTLLQSCERVPFIEKDILKDEAAFKELTEDLGFMSTPVIKIDDESLVGFNQGKLRELLNLK